MVLELKVGAGSALLLVVFYLQNGKADRKKKRNFMNYFIQNFRKNKTVNQSNWLFYYFYYRRQQFQFHKLEIIFFSISIILV